MPARTVSEFMETINPATGRNYTHAEADHKIKELVFGVGYQVDADGRPIEVGKGSASQPTQQHYEAIARAEDRAKLEGRFLNQQPSFTPETFVAGIQAVINNKPPRKKPGRKPKIRTEDSSSEAPSRFAEASQDKSGA